MSYYESGHHGLYRSRNGIIFGICRGIADYLDISVFWTRALLVFALLCTGFWPTLFLYCLAGFIMKREPYVRWTA